MSRRELGERGEDFFYRVSGMSVEVRGNWQQFSIIGEKSFSWRVLREVKCIGKLVLGALVDFYSMNVFIVVDFSC